MLNQITEYNENIEAELINIDGRQLLSVNRLDIVVRFLFIKAILENKMTNEIESLYARTILSRNGASEAEGYYSWDIKEGMESFITELEKLLESIQRDGFKKEYYIPIAKDLGLYNGAHRLAACIALNKNVWIRYCGESRFTNFNFEYFDKNYFSVNDKVMILQGFTDLYQKDMAIYLLYGTIKEKWEYIYAQISAAFDAVGFFDIDLTHNYIAFENLIKDIYQDYSSEGTIAEKLFLLKLAPLNLRVILISNNNPLISPPIDSKEGISDSNTDDFYSRVVSFKKHIRDLMSFDIERDAFLCLHSSDSKQEFIYLRNILLSVNNLQYLEKRLYQKYRPSFLEWLNDLKIFCFKEDIPVEKTCICGSSPLEVVGIRQSTDIDLTVEKSIRDRYGDGVTHFTDNIDLVTKNYVRSNNSVLISDDELIQNNNYHFYFNGFKFVNIDLVYYRKKDSKREKDISDVRLIELYNDFYRYFSNKSILQQKISEELIRRKSQTINFYDKFVSKDDLIKIYDELNQIKENISVIKKSRTYRIANLIKTLLFPDNSIRRKILKIFYKPLKYIYNSFYRRTQQ